MGFKKQAVVIVVPFMMMACGAERKTPFDPNGSSSSSSSSSGKPTVAAKTLKISFSEDGCVKEHNADAFTEFDAFGEQRKLFAWSCVIDQPRTSSNQKLNLIYRYDQAAGCYRQDKKSNGLLLGALSTEINSDCSSVVSAVLKPGYAAEIVTFDVSTKIDESSATGFSFKFSWKNTGSLPLSQYRSSIKVEYADGEIAGQFFEVQELMYQDYVFPGDLIASSANQNSAYYAFQSFKANQLYNVSFGIVDFYGTTIATVKKQVVTN